MQSRQLLYMFVLMNWYYCVQKLNTKKTCVQDIRKEKSNSQKKKLCTRDTKKCSRKETRTNEITKSWAWDSSIENCACTSVLNMTPYECVKHYHISICLKSFCCSKSVFKIFLYYKSSFQINWFNIVWIYNYYNETSYLDYHAFVCIYMSKVPTPLFLFQK